LASKNKFGLPQSPALIQFIVDKRGVVRDVVSLPVGIIKFQENEIKGKTLQDLLIPISFDAERHLDPGKWDVAACSPELYVQIRHPDMVEDAGMFLFSHSHWFSVRHKRYSLVTLIPQTFGAPLTKKFLTLYRSENAPVVMLNDEFKIVSYNLYFLEMLNFINEDAIVSQPILNLMQEEYRDTDLFTYRKKMDYIRETAAQKGPDWDTVFNFYPPSSVNVQTQPMFIPCRAHVYYRNDYIVLERADSDSISTPLVLLNKQVNLPDQDIEVDILFTDLYGNDVTIAFDHPLAGGGRRLCDPAYYFDLQIAETAAYAFTRRSVVVCSGKTKIKNRKTGTHVQIQRIGAQFTITVNGTVIVQYSDPQPIFGKHASHLSFYVYTKPLFIKRLSIKTRPTLFNFEEMDGRAQQLVSFISTPGKLFRFYAEPVSYLNIKSALAVRFYPVPVLPTNTMKEYYLTFFEEARNYIQKNFYRKIDFRKLAKECYVSYKYFISKFRVFFGMSPKAYQMELRLLEAQMLLSNKKHKIIDVCEMIGFNDIANFYKRFKKRFNRSPGDYQ